MLKIGIIGGTEISNTANLLKNIFLSNNKRAEIVKDNKNSSSDYDSEFGQEFNMEDDNIAVIEIEKILESEIDFNKGFENRFDVLIINSIKCDSPFNLNIKGNFPRGNIIVLNSDEKNIFKALKNNDVAPAKVITYGLNNKACITASSISDSAVQCCIQRSLPTFSGDILEQREFSVKIKQPCCDDNIYSILAAVTAALVNDIDIMPTDIVN